MKNKTGQKGQVLLITAMLLASVVAVVLAVTFRSNTETQISKLEEESQKALAAAEAGIEAALRTKGNVSIDSLNISGFTGTTTIQNASMSNTFVSPTLEKDQQYTLYLTTYNQNANTFGAYGSGNLTFYFGNDGNCPALAITIFNDTGTSVTQKLAQPTGCSSGVSGSDLTVSTTNTTIQGYRFTQTFTLTPTDISNGDIAIIRMLSSTPLNLSRFAVVAQTGNLPLQGNTATADVQSTTGLKKVVEQFQSYPQIPAEFFVTSF